MQQLFLPFIQQDELEICYMNCTIKSSSLNGYHRIQHLNISPSANEGNVSIKFDNNSLLDLSIRDFHLDASQLQIDSSFICKSFLSNHDGTIIPLAVNHTFNQYDPYIILVINLLNAWKDIPVSISLFDENNDLCYSTFDIIHASDLPSQGYPTTYCHGIGIELTQLNMKQNVATYNVIVATMDGSQLLNSRITYCDAATANPIYTT